MKQHRTQQEGITLLVTLLLMAVLLGVSASLLNITLKQFELSGIGLASEVAFQAANSGMECALYHEFSDTPEFGAGPGMTGDSITCFNGLSSPDTVNGTDAVDYGEEQRFRFDLYGNTACTEMSIYKFFEATSTDANTTGPQLVLSDGSLARPARCPEGIICTVVQARGYNVGCAAMSSAARLVEREYMQIHQRSP